jgi:hypothetical protein
MWEVEKRTRHFISWHVVLGNRVINIPDGTREEAEAICKVLNELEKLNIICEICGVKGCDRDCCFV